MLLLLARHHDLSLQTLELLFDSVERALVVLLSLGERVTVLRFESGELAFEIADFVALFLCLSLQELVRLLGGEGPFLAVTLEK